MGSQESDTTYQLNHQMILIGSLRQITPTELLKVDCQGNTWEVFFTGQVSDDSSQDLGGYYN